MARSRNKSSRIASLRTAISAPFRKIPFRSTYRKTVVFTRRRPVVSFIAALILLFILIAFGHFLATPKKQPAIQQPVKEVTVYKIGGTPMVKLQAKIEKKGVIKITALSGGIVHSIPVTEGQQVNAGQTLVNLSTNYNGANLPALQTQLARTQYNNTVDTYDTQKDLISKQREVAEKTSANTEELRKISESALTDTRGLLDDNQTALDQINQTISQLEQIPNPTQDQTSALAQAQQAKLQLQSGVNQLRSSVRSLEYQTSTDNPPTKLAELQKDIALKQLDIQQKALDLGREVSRLQYNIAAVGESLMHPSAPFAGTVQRVNVEVGQSVAPGTPLVTISSNTITSTAVISTPRKFAFSISQTEPSKLEVNNNSIDIYPTYISSVATDGLLYSVIYSIPDSLQDKITEEGYLPIEVPISAYNPQPNDPFVPLDAIFQTQEAAFVNVVSGDSVDTKKVMLGTVYGKYVEVISGLSRGDQIILDRNVLSGDHIRITSTQASADPTSQK